MIYIDASRYNNTKKRTGVENYSYYLINELVKSEPENITLISPKKISLAVNQIIIPFPRLWTQIRLSWEVFKNKKINNLFVPSHVLPIIYPKKSTITIHDVAWRRFPKSYGLLSRLYLDWGAKYAVRHAKNIIVPSKTTKEDLIKFFKSDERKITVIPLGYDSIYKDNSWEKSANEVMDKYHLKPRHYFLFVGRIERKKNIGTLIKAFKKIKERHPHIKLILVGKEGVGSEEILKEIDNKNIILTGYIGDIEKQVLLKNCLSFVFPSLFEGFGIPLLEAMDAEVPIIASEIPTSSDIAKNNALFFKADDINTLTNHLKDLVEKKELWDHLIQNHQETLKKYSWENCAQQTLQVIS
ncbi:glycosyltransferase family 4 protein [Patescibacteria group bacterium]|nr:glycosyltransferase family 4 protein [Patescibacteria group bacterium]